MKSDKREIRQQQIETAAYEVLEQKGFAGASMLAIAKAAKASNETLYRWYGDKIGLFSALVEGNAAEVRQMLETGLEAQADPMQILEDFAPALLTLLLGDRAIALNRAAAADSTGALGQAISRSGREAIAPLISQVLEQARADGVLDFDIPQDAVSLFLDLLVGDQQIRRAIGQTKCPTPDEIARRATRALSHFRLLLSPTDR
ncbi:TetR/AcrR family transcriptional regulator [Aliiroseovarius sp.]|uniref:TetR/AcrR family transcriptional regulator n=1 Tax=Aliiroseovarius sp. TaxID=1872442 RepID=UPI003BABD8FD